MVYLNLYLLLYATSSSECLVFLLDSGAGRTGSAADIFSVSLGCSCLHNSQIHKRHFWKEKKKTNFTQEQYDLVVTQEL